MMRRIAAILFLASLSLASGQSFMTTYRPVIFLFTNAANTHTTWVNDGTGAVNFVQDDGSHQPTLVGDYYNFVSKSLTAGIASVLSETNSIAVSLWFFRNSDAAASDFFNNYDLGGSSVGWQTEVEGAGGNFRVGINSGGGAYLFRGSAMSGTGAWHHVFWRYFWDGSAGDFRVLLDGAEQPSLYAAGTMVLRPTAQNKISMGASSAGTPVYYSNHRQSDVRVWIGQTNIDLAIGSNLYAAGRNYCSNCLPAAPAVSTQRDNAIFTFFSKHKR